MSVVCLVDSVLRRQAQRSAAHTLIAVFDSCMTHVTDAARGVRRARCAHMWCRVVACYTSYMLQIAHMGITCGYTGSHLDTRALGTTPAADTHTLSLSPPPRALPSARSVHPAHPAQHRRHPLPSHAPAGSTRCQPTEAPQRTRTRREARQRHSRARASTDTCLSHLSSAAQPCLRSWSHKHTHTHSKAYTCQLALSRSLQPHAQSSQLAGHSACTDSARTHTHTVARSQSRLQSFNCSCTQSRSQ